MNKTWAVFKREYLQAVKKKMFIIMTFLMPFFMVLLFALPTLMISRGMGTRKVVVLDGTGHFRSAFTNAQVKTEEGGGVRNRRDLPEKVDIEYLDARGQDVDAGAKPYLARLTQEGEEKRLDGVLLVPANALSSPDVRLKYYSRSATDLTPQGLARRASRAAQHYRLAADGVDPAKIDSLTADIEVDAIQLSKTGEEKKGGAENLLVGFMLTGMLLLPSFIYGLEIMRGIVQEKTDRVVEVLVSSMSPSQLLVGKILGVAAVGLTQIGVWLAMLGIFAGVQGTIAAMAGENFLQLLRPMTFVYFVIFFLLAYLTYVCIYAIGGAICNSEKEAQQLIGPFMMVMMLPWFLMVGIIANPDSALSVGFSLAPVWGPLTMYVRTLVAEPPVWHVLLSIAVSIATIAAFFWITAKIFRVGILSYGKRPTLPELWRWLKVA
ncbi:MAG TPA: ABC transporter permease [Thermoanaerobaculia bacterium]|jgi:ABC-2 type transport system permease protein